MSNFKHSTTQGQVRICSVGQQGELAMTINIGEECAHNEIQLLYTKVSFFFLRPSYKRMSGIWFQLQSKDVRRSGSLLLPSWALWFRLSCTAHREDEENASPTTNQNHFSENEGSKRKMAENITIGTCKNKWFA